MIFKFLIRDLVCVCLDLVSIPVFILDALLDWIDGF